jgi:hypothetical protein
MKDASSPWLLLLTTAFALASLSESVHARSPVARHAKKEFKELIVQGERPEIVACMVAARQRVAEESNYGTFVWNDDVSATALVNEIDDGAHLVRTVRLNGKAWLRTSGWTAPLQPVAVACEMRDEAPVRVSLEPGN